MEVLLGIQQLVTHRMENKIKIELMKVTTSQRKKEHEHVTIIIFFFFPPERALR